MPPRPRAAARAGFTLIELLVVVAIIGTLASIAAPSFADALDKARNVSAAGNARVVQQGLENFGADHGGRFPNNTEIAQATGANGFLQNNYLPGNQFPVSPWGKVNQKVRVQPMNNPFNIVETYHDTGVPVPKSGARFTPALKGVVKDPPTSQNNYGAICTDTDSNGDNTVYVVGSTGKWKNQAIITTVYTNLGSGSN